MAMSEERKKAVDALNKLLSSDAKSIIAMTVKKETLNEHFLSLSDFDGISVSEAICKLGKIMTNLDMFTGIAKSISVAKNILKSIESGKSDAECAGSIVEASGDILSGIEALLKQVDNDKFEQLTGATKNGLLKDLGFGVASSILSCVSAVISTFDGVDDEEIDSIAKRTIKLSGEIAKYKLGTAGFPLGVKTVVAAGIGIYSGSMQFTKSLEKYYNDDGKISYNDLQYAGFDAFASCLYGFTHEMTLELDDVFFGWIDKITGGDQYSNLTYAEKAAEGYKMISGS